MTFHSLPTTCPSSRHRLLRGTLALLALTPACALLGLEPDEIDVADETGTGGLSTGDPDEETGGSAESNGTVEDSGEEDPGGDGDGDPGDGDGDPGDGDGDPGDGDGEPGDGDGDPGLALCDIATEVFLGPNAVSVIDGPSLLASECGAPGPESVYTFTAVEDGVVSFALTGADFDAAIYLADELCEPIMEVCAVTPEDVQMLMPQGMTVFVVVDSFAGGGTGNLEITQL